MSSTSFATRKPVTVERTIGGKTLSLESGRLAKQASGAVVVRLGDTMTLVATVAGPGPRGARLLPAHGRLPREGLLRGQIPRRVHQAGRAAHHQGNPHLPADRSPDPPALPRHVPRRGPDPGRPDLGRPQERRRRPLDRGGLGLAAAGPRPLLRPDRGHPAGPDRRGIRPLPDGRGARQERPRPRRRQHRSHHRHDRGFRPGAARSRDARSDHGGPPAQPGPHRAPARADRRPRPGAGREARRGPRPAPADDLRPLRPRAPRVQEDPRQGRAQRRGQGPARADHRRILPAGRGGGGHPLAGEDGLPRHRRAGRPRDDPRRPSVRRPRPARPPADPLRGRGPARARTARRSSSAARPRPSSPPCSARGPTSSGSTGS